MQPISMTDKMAETNAQPIAPTPTLMGIPPECRTRIFQFLLEDESATLEVRARGPHYQPSLSKHVAQYRNMPHPLLLVSRQVLIEATPFYKVRSVLDRSLLGYESFQDEFRPNTSPFLRGAVEIVSLTSIGGYQGHHINQEQFPNLKLVIVAMLVDIHQGVHVPVLEVYYKIRHGTTFDEVLDDAGKHAADIVAQARGKIDAYTMHNVPAVDQRSFTILCHVRIRIFRASDFLIDIPDTYLTALFANEYCMTESATMVSLGE